MNLTLTTEQKLIQSTARDFLERECPTTLVREMEKDATGYPKQLWNRMAEMGWMSVPFPESFGGTESFFDLCLLIEEQGRALVPTPFFSTVVLCGPAIARFGAEAQKSIYLGDIADGKRIMAYARHEPRGGWDPANIKCTATQCDDGYMLNGTKLFVPYAHVADDFLVVAHTDEAGDSGITLFLVDAKSSGITSESLQIIGFDHQHKVVFKDVRLPRSSVLGQINEGLPLACAIDEWGAAAKCAEMIGGAQKVLEMSVAYATQRIQFRRPIGSFQAIQHHLANMAVDVESSRFIAYEAIWRLSEGLEASRQVSEAKAWVSEAYQHVCALGHQIHGAVGFTKEHDMHLFFRHVGACELAFGDDNYHLDIVAQKIGL